MHAAWRRFQRSNEGAHLVEYALLAGVVAVGAIGVLTDFRAAVMMLLEPVVDTLGTLIP